MTRSSSIRLPSYADRPRQYRAWPVSFARHLAFNWKTWANPGHAWTKASAALAVSVRCSMRPCPLSTVWAVSCVSLHPPPMVIQPGNVLLEPEEANLPRQSVVNISQIFTVDKIPVGREDWHAFDQTCARHSPWHSSADRATRTRVARGTSCCRGETTRADPIVPTAPRSGSRSTSASRAYAEIRSDQATGTRKLPLATVSVPGHGSLLEAWLSAGTEVALSDGAEEESMAAFPKGNAAGCLERGFLRESYCRLKGRLAHPRSAAGRHARPRPQSLW